MCPVLVIGLALALLVLLAGLFLLGYAKKEGWGMFSKIASYVAILFGTIVFVGGLICAMMCHNYCGDKGSCKGKSSCSKEMQKDCKTKSQCHGETKACSAEKKACASEKKACCKDKAAADSKSTEEVEK